MPMNGDVLGEAIVTALQGIDPEMTPAQIEQLQNAWEAIATQIVTHIQTFGLVTSNIIPDSIVTVGGPATQAGPQAPLPVTGTIS